MNDGALKETVRLALTARNLDQATIESLRVRSGAMANTQLYEMNDAQLRTMLTLLAPIPLWKDRKERKAI